MTYKILSTALLIASSLFLQAQHTNHAILQLHNGDGTTPPVDMSLRDGSGVLGQSYNKTLCGLNWTYDAAMTTTRYTPPGTGFPVTLNIAGMPAGATIDQAYLYWGASAATGSDPSFTINAVPLVATEIGNGPDKCWGLGGTSNFRADVTAEVAATGNGAYNITLNIGSAPVDGVSLVVMYIDPAANYMGTMVIDDGCIVDNSGSPITTTITGFNTCLSSSYAEGFLIAGDMQNNISPPQHSCTIGTSTTVFNNDFWNHDVVSTTVAGGQNSETFTVTPTAGDCYDLVAVGLYFQAGTCSSSSGNLTFNNTFTDENCGNCDGTATAVPSGGNSPYSYTWIPAPGGGQGTPTATGLCAGTYDCIVTDAGGCFTDTTTIVIGAIPGTVSITPVGPYCIGDPAINLIGSITGGNWTGTGITDAVNGTFDPATAGVGTWSITYDVTTPCVAQDITTITITGPLDASINPAGPYCLNDPIATMTAVDPGGAWSGTGIASATAGTFDPLMAGQGTHTITYSIPGGCGDTQTQTIVVNPLPVVNLGNDTTVCSGQIASFDATTAGMTYLWSTGSTNPTISTTSAGTYWVRITDGNGCAGYDSVVVNVIPLPVLSLSNDTAICIGDPAFLSASSNETVTWSTLQTGNAITVNPVVDTWYYATTSNACGALIDSVLVTINPLPVAEAGADGGTALGIPATLSGSGGVAYSWTPSSTINCPTCPSTIAFITDTTVFYLTVWDANGCSSTDSVTINLLDEIQLWVPNIFSPNGDGVNDILMVHGSIQLKSMIFMVYNRWGEKVFETTDLYEGWDGTQNGKVLTTGVFAYVVRGVTYLSDEVILSGDVTLMRKN
jgi:gliding motility-associated-like protein